MSCNCNCVPCTCSGCCISVVGLEMSSPVNLHPSTTTVCNGNYLNNMFWRPGVNGFPGSCVLDLMTYEQVFAVLQHHPKAAEHLRRITDDETLVALANSVKLIEPEISSNQKVVNRLNANTTTRFYTLLRGNIDGTPGTGRSRRIP